MTSKDLDSCLNSFFAYSLFTVTVQIITQAGISAPWDLSLIPRKDSHWETPQTQETCGTRIT